MNDEDVFVAEEEAVVLVVIFGVPEDVEGRAKTFNSIQFNSNQFDSIPTLIQFNSIQTSICLKLTLKYRGGPYLSTKILKVKILKAKKARKLRRVSLG